MAITYHDITHTYSPSITDDNLDAHYSGTKPSRFRDYSWLLNLLPPAISSTLFLDKPVAPGKRYGVR